MSYCFKRIGNEWTAMPVGEREKVLSRHGLCSNVPAKVYKDTFPTGFGGLGANAFGEPFAEKIVLGNEYLYARPKEGVPQPPPLAGVLSEIRELLLAGKGEEAAHLASETAKRDGGYEGLLRETGAPQNWEMPFEGYSRHKGGCLHMEMPEQKGWNYLRTLDFLSGKTGVFWDDERGRWKREMFVSRVDGCLLMKVEPPQGVAYEVEIWLDGFTQAGEHGWEGISLPKEVACQTVVDENVIVLTGTYQYNAAGEAYHILAAVHGQGGQVCQKEKKLVFRGRGTLLAEMRLIHGAGQRERLDACIELMKGKVPDYEGIEAAHLRVHKELMERSQLHLCSQGEWLLSFEELLEKQYAEQNISLPLLEKLYDAGRYFLIISTGELPPTTGQWNINVNLQICAGNQANLPEMMAVYFRFIESKLADFRTNAQRILGCGGILADIHPDMDNGLLYHFSYTWPHQYYTAGAGWMYNEFFNYYLVTGDKDFLREHVWPGLREIGLFYEDFLKDRDDEGNYLFYPCLSPENNPVGQSPLTINAVMDIMVCREVLSRLLDCCQILDIQTDKQQVWQEILNHLPTLLADETGGLKEWAWEPYEENLNHRCVSHHYDVWPGMYINCGDTPELARAVQISNRQRPLENDSCHGIMHRLLAAIRLRDQGYTEALLNMLLGYGFINKGLMTNHYPYAVLFPDMSGSMPAVLIEMLINSVPGKIHFLPCTANILKNGQITGVCTFTSVNIESMEWDTEKGRITARVRSRIDQAIRIGAGDGITKISIGGADGCLSDGYSKMWLNQNEQIELIIDCKNQTTKQ